MNIAKTKNSRERWNGTDKKGTTVKVGQLIFNNRIIGRITKIKGRKVTARRIHWNESAPVETASWTMPADVSVLDDSDKLKLPAGKNTVPPSIHFTSASVAR